LAELASKDDGTPEAIRPPSSERAADGAAKLSARTLDRQDALVLAMQLHRGGHLDHADALYRRILAVVPQDPDALHYLGVLCHQRGRNRDAIALITRAIDVAPDNVDAHNNLGNVLHQAGRMEEAADAYRRALALRPDHASALNNLGIALRTLGHLDGAVAAHRRAIELDPRLAEAHLGLGRALREAGRLEAAMDAFAKVLDLDPRQAQAYQSLGSMLYRAGRHADAVGVFDRWLEHAPGDPVALHMRAACSGWDVPTRASDDFVRQVFDTLAAGFDEHLRQLQYRAPELTIDALALRVGAPRRQLDILDAGCGTGLCGPLLRPYARRLVGVDLSNAMLDKAVDRGVYDELVTAELTSYLRSQPEAFDIIASVDTLVYFGELAPVFVAASAALRAGGHFSFTVESADGRGERASGGYHINASGRYSHHEAHIRQRLAACDLAAVSVASVTLRKESGSGVAGYVVVATKA
jgi:predicted TPR repeat methyltransferase